MTIDLFILDDEPSICAVLTGMAGHARFSSVSFQSGVQALAYLKTCSELPRAYFVDMRIPGSEEELRSSKDIFDYLSSRNQTERFNFMTGHISEHDLLVQQQTHAPILQKPLQVFEEITRLFSELRALKDI